MSTAQPYARTGDAPPRRGTDAQPLLSVVNLTKHFPIRGGLMNATVATVQAVDGISFDVRRGETLGIVGESGCGKSTTARLLVRLIEPDRGEVIFDGEGIGPGGISLKQMRRQVQMVFQDSYASLNPRLPVRDSIAFAPRVHAVPAREANARADMLLDAVGLAASAFGHRYPHQLSGGQRQRVNIARALALEPSLVVLDEPVSALDKSVEAQVLNLLVDLKTKFGLTYVFISHDLNVVQFISDRVLVMYLGKIVELGRVDEIYGNPRHPYTRALLASRPSLDPDRRTREAPLSGDPPNPINPPSGCRFRTRCRHAQDVCARVEPPLAEDGTGHLVACHMAAQPDAFPPAGRA